MEYFLHKTYCTYLSLYYISYDYFVLIKVPFGDLETRDFDTTMSAEVETGAVRPSV